VFPQAADWWLLRAAKAEVALYVRSWRVSNPRKLKSGGWEA